jgi:hypothetical protein
VISKPLIFGPLSVVPTTLREVDGRDLPGTTITLKRIDVLDDGLHDFCCKS